MKNLRSLFGITIFLLVILFTSCDPSTQTITITATPTAHYGEYVVHRSQGVPCGGTSPFDQDFGPRINNYQPHAGFKSHWNPGADPLPCQTIQASICRGVFNFDLSDFLATHRVNEITGAQIVVSRMIPIGGEVHVAVTQAWGYDSGIIPSNPNLNYANFTLKAVNESWPPMEILTGIRAGNISSVPLMVQNSDRNVFRSTQVSTFDVTNEIQQINSDPRVVDPTLFGFVIEPVRIQTAYMSSNHAYGAFDVQLLLTYRR